MKCSDILTLLFGLLIASRSLMAADVPQTVEELWADFDSRNDALETEVIREFKEDGGVFRHVRFVVGTFKGQTARMTAIYGFPEGANVGEKGWGKGRGKGVRNRFHKNGSTTKRRRPFSACHRSVGGP